MIPWPTSLSMRMHAHSEQRFTFAAAPALRVLAEMQMRQRDDLSCRNYQRQRVKSYATKDGYRIGPQE